MMVSLIVLQNQKNAARIEPVICVVHACADDTVVAADCPEGLQSLLDIGVDYSKMERYTVYSSLLKASSSRYLTYGEEAERNPVIPGTYMVITCQQWT